MSLPADIADYLRAQAEDRSEPISGFVADLARWHQEMELQEAMIRGLQEDVERDRQLAEEWAATRPDLPD